MTHEEKQIHNAVHTELKEFEEFKALVKRMRGAQKEFESDSPHMDYDKIMEVYRDKFHLESEVDEYLKKMEDNERRKALEAENTEFDYGHNVKHYSED